MAAPVGPRNISLFDAPAPDGFVYQTAFITPDEERALIGAVAGIEFENFEMRGIVVRSALSCVGLTLPE